ncbi:putative saccharopine dehydrogenase, NADP binding domain, NAD(P)-binding domain superfamily [Helianthus annuus]|nr:putative saccharopine dehydrogenase, NADP binding domain, NAD(P)-binding domain superfamily [Helianthus annuus]
MTELQLPTYDIIIFGASGFTGKYVVREALKFLNSPNSPLKTLALAGRNSSKLTESLKWASGSKTHPTIPLIIADTSDPSSLRRMASQTKLVLNCVGPYRKQWVEPAVPNRVEAYLNLESDKRIVGNFGTFESAVLGVANVHKLAELRRSRPKRSRPNIPGPGPIKGSTIEHQEELGLWAVKLPSADAIVVRRTFSTLTENPRGLQGVNEDPKQAEKRAAFWSTIKPAHFGVKIATKSLLSVFGFIAIGLSIGLLGSFAFGRWLLLKFPSIFTFGGFRKKGPTEEEVASATFKMWFVGYGFSDAKLASQEGAKPDTEIITRVMGPEIGYLTTPIILIQCALIVLKQRQDLPKGGVLTPGIVFGPFDLQDRLQENGISFDLISEK